MGCPWWICGLKNSGMAVCMVKRSKEGKVLLTIDGQQDSQGVEVTHAAHLRIFEEGEKDYGLAIVSCAKVLGDDSKKAEENIDLSKLEMTAFFSFMDPNNPSVRMAPEVALRHFNTRFKTFADKDAKGRARELWLAYSDEAYMGKDMEKSSGHRPLYESQPVPPSYT